MHDLPHGPPSARDTACRAGPGPGRPPLSADAREHRRSRGPARRARRRRSPRGFEPADGKTQSWLINPPGTPAVCADQAAIFDEVRIGSRAILAAREAAMTASRERPIFHSSMRFVRERFGRRRLPASSPRSPRRTGASSGRRSWPRPGAQSPPPPLMQEPEATDQGRPDMLPEIEHHLLRTMGSPASTRSSSRLARTSSRVARRERLRALLRHGDHARGRGPPGRTVVNITSFGRRERPVL